jgi:hypothetical protein
VSLTYSLVCDAAKLQVWVGQGHGGKMTSFYSGEEATMRALGCFLEKTRGKAVHLRCDDRRTRHHDYRAIADATQDEGGRWTPIYRKP